jgi:hypothetical protein
VLGGLSALNLIWKQNDYTIVNWMRHVLRFWGYSFNTNNWMENQQG